MASENGRSKTEWRPLGVVNCKLVLPIKYDGKIIGVFNSECEEVNYYNKEMIRRLYKILDNFSSRIVELGYVGNMNNMDIPYVHI